MSGPLDWINPFYSLDDRAFTSRFDLSRRAELWLGGRDLLCLFLFGYEGASPHPIDCRHCSHAIYQRLSDQSVVYGSLSWTSRDLLFSDPYFAAEVEQTGCCFHFSRQRALSCRYHGGDVCIQCAAE